MNRKPLSPKRRKVFAALSIGNSLIGIGFLIPNLIFQIPSGYILLSIPFGCIATLFAIKIKSALLMLLDLFTICSMFILMFLGYLAEAISAAL